MRVNYDLRTGDMQHARKDGNGEVELLHGAWLFEPRGSKPTAAASLPPSLPSESSPHRLAGLDGMECGNAPTQTHAASPGRNPKLRVACLEPAHRSLTASPPTRRNRRNSASEYFWQCTDRTDVRPVLVRPMPAIRPLLLSTYSWSP